MDCPQECHDRFDRIDESLDEIKDKLWKGNGQPPLTVQLDRLNIFKKGVCWVGGALTITVLGIIARLVVAHLQAH